MKPIRLYLAGGIDKRANFGETGYRQLVTKALAKWSDVVEILNPCFQEGAIFDKFQVKKSELDTLKQTDWTKSKQLGEHIVKKDLRLIRRATHVMVYFDDSVNEGAGTLSEMTVIKWLIRRPLLIIKKVPNKDIRTWTTGCFDNTVPEFTSIDEALQWFEKEVIDSLSVKR